MLTNFSFRAVLYNRFFVFIFFTVCGVLEFVSSFLLLCLNLLICNLSLAQKYIFFAFKQEPINFSIIMFSVRLLGQFSEILSLKKGV